MSPWSHSSPVRVGLAIGVVFGLWNLALSLLFPLADDTIPALLSFYGPMFALWGLSGAFAARAAHSWSAGVKFAAIVAFTTFCVYDLSVILRVNLFLNELTGRADWHSMIKGAPFKIGVATAIGTVFGCLGAFFGRLRYV